MVQRTFQFSGRIGLYPDRSPPPPRTTKRSNPDRPPVERKPIRLSVQAVCEGQGRYRGNLTWMNCRRIDNPKGEEFTVLSTVWSDGYLQLTVNGQRTVDAREVYFTEPVEFHPCYRFSLRKAQQFQRELNAVRSFADLADTLGSTMS